MRISDLNTPSKVALGILAVTVVGTAITAIALGAMHKNPTGCLGVLAAGGVLAGVVKYVDLKKRQVELVTGTKSTEKTRSKPKPKPLPQKVGSQKKGARYGRSTGPAYTGRHSEGNRYILNEDI